MLYHKFSNLKKAFRMIPVPPQVLTVCCVIWLEYLSTICRGPRYVQVLIESLSTLILTLNKSSILPSFFSKSEFLLFSSADIFSIVRSDYKDKSKQIQNQSQNITCHHIFLFSFFFFWKMHLLTSIAGQITQEIKYVLLILFFKPQQHLLNPYCKNIRSGVNYINPHNTVH